MTSFNISAFGSITTQAGKVLKFEDFDKDGDGKITEEEYKEVLKEANLDTVELSTNDKDGDKVISQEEFKNWENKIAMQDAVNDMAGQISTDFNGTNSERIASVQEELQAFVEDYSDTNSGENFSIDQFKQALENKYAEIKSGLNDDIINDMVDGTIELIQSGGLKGDNTIDQTTDPEVLKIIGKKLGQLANEFVKNYTGNDLETDLMTYLHDQACNGDVSKMMNARSEYEKDIEKYRNDYYISSKELSDIKKIVTELLESALKENVVLNVAGSNIATDAAITSLLAKYNADNIMDLVDEVDTALANLNDETLVEKTTEDVSASRIKSVSGSDLSVNATTIDYTKISGYSQGDTIWNFGSSSYNETRNAATELLNSDNLKNQIKEQLNKELEAKGLSIQDFEEIIDTVYAQTITETLDSDGMINTEKRWFFGRRLARVDVQNCVDTFITKFNTNIQNAIDGMNESDTDMDLQDLDYSELGEEEYQNYMTEKTTVSWFSDSNSKADETLDKLQSQMLKKAMAMCNANDIEFDLTSFNAIFNNSKAVGIQNGTGGSWFASHINTRTLVDSFTQDFKTNYTAWVDAEKAKNTTANEE